MLPIVHLIDEKKHYNFLSQKRNDPFTGEPLRHGDKIVICAGCETAFFESSWNAINRVCSNCKGSVTLSNIPNNNLRKHLGNGQRLINKYYRQKKKERNFKELDKSTIHIHQKRKKLKNIVILGLSLIMLFIIIYIKDIRVIKRFLSPNNKVIEKKLFYNTRITLKGAVVCSSVRDLEPIDIRTVFNSNTNKVYCWTNVLNAKDRYINHIYYYDGEEVANVRLNIRHNQRYRTYSIKNVWPGNWSVKIVDDQGNELRELIFRVEYR